MIESHIYEKKLFFSGFDDWTSAHADAFANAQIPTERNGTMSSSKPSGEIGIKSILIAYDFSEASRKALRHSLAIARHYGAKLHLAYVVSSIGYPSIHSLRRRSVAAVYQQSRKNLGTRFHTQGDLGNRES